MDLPKLPNCPVCGREAVTWSMCSVTGPTKVGCNNVLPGCAMLPKGRRFYSSAKNAAKAWIKFVEKTKEKKERK